MKPGETESLAQSFIITWISHVSSATGWTKAPNPSTGFIFHATILSTVANCYRGILSQQPSIFTNLHVYHVCVSIYRCVRGLIVHPQELIGAGRLFSEKLAIPGPIMFWYVLICFAILTKFSWLFSFVVSCHDVLSPSYSLSDFHVAFATCCLALLLFFPVCVTFRPLSSSDDPLCLRLCTDVWTGCVKKLAKNRFHRPSGLSSMVKICQENNYLEKQNTLNPLQNLFRMF